MNSVMMEIINARCVADPKRRSEVGGANMSIPQLASEMERRGYKFSTQTYYLRLEPRRKNSAHGRRHVHTVPVKLARAQENARKPHVAARFCLATARMLKEAAAAFGPDMPVPRK